MGRRAVRSMNTRATLDTEIRSGSVKQFNDDWTRQPNDIVSKQEWWCQYESKMVASRVDDSRTGHLRLALPSLLARHPSKETFQFLL